MSEILITGINGFVGQHLAHEFNAQSYDVIGVGRESAPVPELYGLVKEYVPCDMTKPDDVSKIPFKRLKAVINLAGLAAVGKSFDDPDLYMDVNVSVLSVMCEQIKTLELKNLRVVAVSSGAVYAPDQPMPLIEESLTDKTSSPYVASKLAMEDYAKKFKNDGYECVIARPFNHIGPGQLGGFLLTDLYDKLQSSPDGVLRVGNLKTQRDYTDVRDVAKAYVALATSKKLTYDTYNVCTGRAISGERMLKTMAKACGKKDIKVEVDDKLFRSSDSPILYGDNSRLQKDTGWTPVIPFEQTVADFVVSKQA